MWKAAAGQNIKVAVDDGGDDWETDPDFEVPGSFSSPSTLHSLSSTVLFIFFPCMFMVLFLEFLQNDVSEKEQRWGAKTVAGSGHQEHIE